MFQEPQAPETKVKIWSKDYLHLIEKDWVREYFIKLNICKSMGLHGGMHPRVLRKLEMSSQGHSVSSLNDHSDQEKCPRTGVANATPNFIKKDAGTYRPVILTLTLRR